MTEDCLLVQKQKRIIQQTEDYTYFGLLPWTVTGGLHKDEHSFPDDLLATGYHSSRAQGRHSCRRRVRLRDVGGALLYQTTTAKKHQLRVSLQMSEKRTSKSTYGRLDGNFPSTTVERMDLPGSRP